MCNCLVYSNLLYCISIWGFRPKTALQPLYSMQKKIIHDVAAVSLYELSQQNFKIFRYTCLITLTFMWWLYLLINWFAQRSFNYYKRFDHTTPYFIHKILNKISNFMFETIFFSFLNGFILLNSVCYVLLSPTY